MLANGCVWFTSVQECVPEIVDLKKKVFAKLDELVDEGVVMASSSSCIVPSSFTDGLRHRSQCIVAHPVRQPFTTFLMHTHIFHPLSPPCSLAFLVNFLSKASNRDC